MLKRLKTKIHKFLRWSEKYTRTDMVYLTKGGGWLFLGYGVQMATGLILTTYFANSLSQAAYGTYQFVIAMSAFVSIFTLTGMGTAIVQHTASGEVGALRHGFRAQLLWNLGIVISALALSAYYYWRDDFQLSIAFMLVAFFQPLIVSFALHKVYLQGIKHFEEYTILDIIQRLFPFTLSLFALCFTKNPIILVSVFLASQAFSLGCAYYYIVYKHKLPLTRNPDLVKYSRHLSLMDSFMQGAFAIDKIVIWALLGAAPVAIYSLAYLPVTHLYTVFGFVRQLAFPKLTNQSFSTLQIFLPQKIKAFLLLCMAVSGLYIFTAPFIFQLLFPAYTESVLYSQVLSLVILAVPFTLIKQTFAAHKMTSELYTINLTTALVRIVVTFGGVWLFGIWGIVISIIVSEYYSAIIQAILFYRLRKSVIDDTLLK
jgi:O-antigen/teichoic acid export membrane protein